MSDSVYIVCGDTGEYSDFQQWMVEAYLSEDAAKARVIELEQLILAQGFTKIEDEGEIRMAQPKNWRWFDGDEKIENAIGCEFHCDYNGMRWYYMAVPLKGAK